MDGERWLLVKKRFDEVADADDLEREAAVRELRSKAPEAAGELERLLKSDAAYVGDSSEASAVERTSEEPDPAALVGTRVGAFVLEAFVAQGATSEVYRARSVDGGDVMAVKVLRHGLASTEVRRRFALERRTLESLDHPSIVALTGADVLPDGRPCLLMEFVDGVPVDRFSEGRSTDARLELLVRVCAAVQHAHRNLVVHRDLKPANVLVEADGTPKVLDFGVAKLLGPSDDDAATHPGWIAPLTPRYASPEQWSGGTITTASDVYSLGVLLGELLDASDRREGGDLHAVIAAATQTDPELRYPGVQSLAEDIERFRSGHAVKARRATRLYRLTRFVRRNRVSVALTTALVIGLFTALSFLHGQWRRAQQAELVGWQAHAEALQVSLFFNRLMSASDPEALLADEGFVVALDEAAARVGDDLAGSPEAEGRVRMALAKIYAHLGSLQKAASHAARALQCAKESPGFDDREREAILAFVREELSPSGKREEAETAFDEHPITPGSPAEWEAMLEACREAGVNGVVTRAGRQGDRVLWVECGPNARSIRRLWRGNNEWQRTWSRFKVICFDPADN